MRRSEAPKMKEVADAAYMVAEEKAMEAAPVSVQKQIGETTITFDIAIPYTIPSDGKFRL